MEFFGIEWTSLNKFKLRKKLLSAQDASRDKVALQYFEERNIYSSPSVMNKSLL